MATGPDRVREQGVVMTAPAAAPPPPRLPDNEVDAAAPSEGEDALPGAGGGHESRRASLEAAVKSWGLRVASLALGLVCWYWATKANLHWYIRFDNVPPPLKVGAAFWQHARESTFYVHILVSMRRILYAYGLATGIGVGFGLIMGRSRLARDLFMPYVEVLRPIPAVA